MTKEKKDSTVGWSCIVAVLLENLAVKAYLFPERNYFDLLVSGFFVHIAVAAVVFFTLMKIIKSDDE